MKVKTQSLLAKSRDSALLAVEIYNKPRTAFKSSGYIVLMNIAWTSLLHAIFEQNNTPYYYKKGRRYIYKDGDKATFELEKSIPLYFTNTDKAIVNNLTLINRLRDKIEHRFAPSFDAKIFGECQACLFNYEEIIAREFGAKYCINENLAFSLQFSDVFTPEQRRTLSKRQSRDLADLNRFIDEYRDGLSDDVYDSKYSYRMFLIPKTANHRGSADIAIDFVKDPIEADGVNKYIIGIQEKKVIADGHLPREVSKAVQEKIKDKMSSGFKFTTNLHAKCWRYYEVRPENGSPTPEKTIEKYCHYNKVFKKYMFTDEWINYLSNKIVDKAEYRRIIGRGL